MKCFYKSLKNDLFLNCRVKKSLVTAIFLVFFIFSYGVLKSQSRLYISNDNHTDYMWSGNEHTYDTAFVSMIDAWMVNNNNSKLLSI